MKRHQEIEAAATKDANKFNSTPSQVSSHGHTFSRGCEWADQNQPWGKDLIADRNIQIEHNLELEAKLQIATEALEHIENNCGCPKPEDCYDKAKEALQKIKDGK